MNVPDDASNHDRILATKTIRDNTRNQSTEPGTSRHGSSNTTLVEGTGTGALVHIVEGRAPGTLVKVALVSRCADNSRHGRNIKPEQTAANDGDGRDHVDVAHGDHGERSTV